MLKSHEEALKKFSGIGKKAKIVLFGSVARGDYRLDSDIDIALITDDMDTVKEARRIADDLLAQGKLISIKHFTKADFERRVRMKDSFVMEVLKGKVIYGGG